MSERERVSALGKAINIRRVELGLSRNDLRDRSGLSYPYLAELEKGVKSASSRSLEAIANALEIRPHELLARAEELMLSEGFGTSQALAPSRAVAPPPAARSAATAGARRWFGPEEEPPVRARSARRRSPAPEASPVLTEARVREIVREEIRRALGESLK